MPIGRTNLDSGRLLVPRWTDKSFPANRDRQGVAQKPDFDFTELGLLFPYDLTTEEIFILDQMLHTKKLDTNLRLHIHFVQTSALLPNFVCEYRYYNNGATIPAWIQVKTDDGAGPVLPYVIGSIVQVIRFPDIIPPSPEEVSAILDLKIWRDDDRVLGDVLVKYVDYHFQVDTDGSREEFSK